MKPARPGSRPDIRVPHSEDVYEILERHDNSIEELKGFAQKSELADATIISKLNGLEATDRHATTKLIAGFVITLITTIGSVVGTIIAIRPGAPPAPIARSALDIALDRCRAMQPGSPSRDECTAKAVEANP